MSDLNKFREDTKKWLDENCPSSMRSGADPNIPHDEVWGGRNAKYKNPESKLWLDRMGEKGWTMPTVPKEYGCWLLFFWNMELKNRRKSIFQKL